jgi:hypothetical protein
MVPGLSERERLATDVQRLEWLADAVLGPTRPSGGRASRFGGSAEAPPVPPPYRRNASRSHKVQSAWFRGLLRREKRQTASASTC